VLHAVGHQHNPAGAESGLGQGDPIVSKRRAQRAVRLSAHRWAGRRVEATRPPGAAQHGSGRADFEGCGREYGAPPQGPQGGRQGWGAGWDRGASSPPDGALAELPALGAGPPLADARALLGAAGARPDLCDLWGSQGDACWLGTSVDAG
jgi:hypothetical protein